MENLDIEKPEQYEELFIEVPASDYASPVTLGDRTYVHYRLISPAGDAIDQFDFFWINGRLKMDVLEKDGIRRLRLYRSGPIYYYRSAHVISSFKEPELACPCPRG